MCSTEIADGAAPGQPCITEEDCRSRLCDYDTDVCTTPCDDDGDCAAYGMVCGTVTPGDWVSYSGCVPQ